MTGEDSCESSQSLLPLRSAAQPDAYPPSGNEHAPEDVAPQTREGGLAGTVSAADPTIEEAEWSYYGDDGGCATRVGKDGEPLWAELCSMRKDVYQLGGELDIEQIERN